MYVCMYVRRHVFGMITSGSTLYEHNIYVCIYKFEFINNTFLSIMHVCTVCMYVCTVCGMLTSGSIFVDIWPVKSTAASSKLES